MRALRCHEIGSLPGLTVDDVADPHAGDGQVVVDVKAAAVNFVDALIVAGRYQLRPPTPFTPGVDIAGVVSAVGTGCRRFSVEDRVHGVSLLGGFAERVAVPETLLRLTPDGLPSDLACTTGTPYRTAYDALASVANVVTGEDVVILGASGAVGSAAIGVGKALGARVIACASTPEKLAFCTSLGADEVIDYTTCDLKSAIKGLCRDGADVVVDLVGGEASEPALRATGHGGRFVVIGFASGEIAKVPLNLVLLKGSTICGYDIADFERHYPREAQANRVKLEQMLCDGRIKPPIAARYGLAEAPQALARAASRDKLGITILDLSGNSL